MAQNLLCIEIQSGSTIWNRTVLNFTVPTLEELKEYYINLCGIEDAIITLRVERVPVSFRPNLLTTSDTVPTSFPSYDLESDAGEDEERVQYKKFIGQLCDMERTRARLNTLKKTEESGVEPEESHVATEHTKASLQKVRAWVQKILRSLNPDEDEESLIEVAIDDTIPLAWVVTPALADMRDSNGSRLITNTLLGKKWEALLGTDLYPDLIVTRRISPANWLFQHATSEPLVKAALDWYIASQDAKLTNGISDWLPRVDMDIHKLFKPFRQVSIAEKFLTTEGGAKENGKNQIFSILSAFESKCLCSSLTDITIHPVSTDIFQKYLKYMCRAHGFAYEMYRGMESVSRLVQRWGRGAYGFRKDVEPTVEAWNEVWKVIMRGNPTPDRVLLFIQTLEAWDPIESDTITAELRMEMARKWMNIFFDNELVVEPKQNIRTIYLHEKLREWCFRFIPDKLFGNKFSTAAIGPVLNLRGHASSKRNSGRFTLGVRFRDETIVDPTLLKMKKNRMSRADLEKEAEKEELEKILAAEKEEAERIAAMAANLEAEEARKAKEEEHKKYIEGLASKKEYSRQWRKNNRAEKIAMMVAGVELPDDVRPKYKLAQDLSGVQENTIYLGTL